MTVKQRHAKRFQWQPSQSANPDIGRAPMVPSPIDSTQDPTHFHRLAALGQQIATVAHELRNPLEVAINELFLIRQRVASNSCDELEHNFDMAERALRQATIVCQDLTADAKTRMPQPVVLEIALVMEEVIQAIPPPVGIDVSTTLARTALLIDEVHFIEMLNNLIQNGYDAMPDGGQLHVAVSRQDQDVVIEVSDTGHGFDPDLVHHLFDPFVTTKPYGTGLGLAVVRRLAEAQGGTVCIANQPTGGARVTLRLPQDGLSFPVRSA